MIDAGSYGLDLHAIDQGKIMVSVVSTRLNVCYHDIAVVVFPLVYERSGLGYSILSNKNKPSKYVVCGFQCGAPHQWIAQQQVNNPEKQCLNSHV